jgi:polysaccharide biosynthesis protein PslG
MNRVMIRLLSLSLLLTFAIAAPAAAKSPIVGVGDQEPAMFADANFQKLGVKHSRLVLAWDWHKHPDLVAHTDAWMAAAQTAGIRPLVAFNVNWGTKHGYRKPPSIAAYRKSFRLVRERYPFVTDFTAWNEANHTAQPTAKNPRLAARYFNAMRGDCRSCTIVAADVLDTKDMVTWIKKFKKHARGARIWGIHNYKDANDATNTTKQLLKVVKGDVWLTETGGILRLKPADGSRGGRKHTKAEQAKAVKRVYKIAKSNRRIKRVYFYEWAKKKDNRWDSAFVERNGALRPAYGALKRGLRSAGATGAATVR